MATERVSHVDQGTATGSSGNGKDKANGRHGNGHDRKSLSRTTLTIDAATGTFSIFDPSAAPEPDPTQTVPDSDTTTSEAPDAPETEPSSLIDNELVLSPECYRLYDSENPQCIVDLLQEAGISRAIRRPLFGARPNIPYNIPYVMVHGEESVCLPVTQVLEHGVVQRDLERIENSDLAYDVGMAIFGDDVHIFGGKVTEVEGVEGVFEMQPDIDPLVFSVPTEEAIIEAYRNERHAVRRQTMVTQAIAPEQLPKDLDLRMTFAQRRRFTNPSYQQQMGEVLNKQSREIASIVMQARLATEQTLALDGQVEPNSWDVTKQAYRSVWESLTAARATGEDDPASALDYWRAAIRNVDGLRLTEEETALLFTQLAQSSTSVFRQNLRTAGRERVKVLVGEAFQEWDPREEVVIGLLENLTPLPAKMQRKGIAATLLSGEYTKIIPFDAKAIAASLPTYEQLLQNLAKAGMDDSEIVTLASMVDIAWRYYEQQVAYGSMLKELYASLPQLLDDQTIKQKYAPEQKFEQALFYQPPAPQKVATGVFGQQGKPVTPPAPVSQENLRRDLALLLKGRIAGVVPHIEGKKKQRDTLTTKRQTREIRGIVAELGPEIEGADKELDLYRRVLSYLEDPSGGKGLLYQAREQLRLIVKPTPQEINEATAILRRQQPQIQAIQVEQALTKQIENEALALAASLIPQTIKVADILTNSHVEEPYERAKYWIMGMLQARINLTTQTSGIRAQVEQEIATDIGVRVPLGDKQPENGTPNPGNGKKKKKKSNRN